MKTFSFRKTEHHSLMAFYDAMVDEDEVMEILRKNFEDEDTVQRYLTALSTPNHEDHEAAVSIITGHELVWDRWEWLDEDDLWTDRKGGYDVDYAFESVYEAEDEPKNEELTTIPPWPFPAATTNEFISESQEPVEKLPVCEESGEYTIKIYSRGLDAGIGEISKEQYDYWHDKDEDVLHDALMENIEWEESDCPENARFNGYYNDYYLVGAHGADADDSYVEIINPKGEKIYDGNIEALYDKINATSTVKDHDCRVFNSYVGLDEMEPGYYLMYQDGGKGCYFEGTLKVEKFDFSKLSFTITEFEGVDIIEGVLYDDDEIENWGGDWTGKWSSISVHHVE